MDTSAINHAYDAGGTKLLDAYKKLAKVHGLKLAVTDVVLDELFVRWAKRGTPPPVKLDPARAKLQKWLLANAEKLTTQERQLLGNFRADRFTDYGGSDRGERSIIEHLLSNSESRKSAVFSDDTRFHNKLAAWVTDKKIPNIPDVPLNAEKLIFTNPEKVIFANPDMLASACKEHIIHIPQHERLVGKFREACAIFNKTLPGSYSAQLDERFREKADLQRLREGKPVKGVRILGAFGRLMAATGIAFVAIDTMATAAHAATQIRDGDNEGATETVAEFGGRMAGALVGAEQGAFLGAALGSVVPGLGTTIGAIAGGAIGGALGATIGEGAAKELLEAVHGNSHSPIDERLTDSTMRDYREPEIQALRNDLYDAGYSTEEVNYVCASVSAAREAERPAGEADEVRDTLSGLAETVTSSARAVVTEDSTQTPADSVAAPAVDLEVKAELVSGGDDAGEGEAAPRTDAASTMPDTVDPTNAAPARADAEDQTGLSGVARDAGEAQPSDTPADERSAGAVPPAEGPVTGRGETASNMPSDAGDVVAPSKPDDLPAAPEQPQASLSPQGEAAPAPPNEAPAASTEVPKEEAAQRVDVAPDEQMQQGVGDPVPSIAPENAVVETTAPASPPLPAAAQKEDPVVPEGNAVVQASPPAAPADTVSKDPGLQELPDDAGPNSGTTSPPIGEHASPVADKTEPRGDERGMFSDREPNPAETDIAPAPAETETLPDQPPPAAEPLDHETLQDMDELLHDETMAANDDETAADDMMVGWVPSDDEATIHAGLADLEDAEAHETLNNEGVESLVVTGALLTPLGGSDDQLEPIFSEDERLQDIEEIVGDEINDTGDDEAIVADLSDELRAPDHEELTGDDWRGATDFDREPSWGGGHAPGDDHPYAGNDVPGYGDNDDPFGADAAGDGHDSASSPDDEDE